MSNVQAQAKLEVGQLICTGKGGIGLIIVSNKSFACQIRPAGGRPQQSYTGTGTGTGTGTVTVTVTNVGIDLGATGNTLLVWSVLASSDRVASNMLSGNYVGAGANASIGVGGGGNLLVGGRPVRLRAVPERVYAPGGLQAMDEKTIKLIRRLFVEISVRLENAHVIALGGQARGFDVAAYRRRAELLAGTGAVVTLSTFISVVNSRQ